MASFSASSDYLSEEPGFHHINTSESDLIGYWSFDLDATDLTNNDYDGTIAGGEITTSGYIGSAYNAVAGTSYVNLDSHISDFENLESGTITAWFKTETSGVAQFLISFSDSDDQSSEIGLNLWSETDQLRFGVREDDVASLDIRTDDTYNDGNWHFVAITVGDSGNALYIDGEIPDVTYYNGTSETQSFITNVSGLDRMRIGNNVDSDNGNQYTFDGSIDEVMIFNRSLSQSEIEEIYSSAYTRFYSRANGSISSFEEIMPSSNTLTLTADAQELNGTSLNLTLLEWDSTKGYIDGTNSADPNLVAYYHADENADDSGGNAYHGTLTGGASAGSDGKFGNAFEFEGEEFVNLDNPEPLLLDNTDFTISLWFNRDSGVADNDYLISSWNSENGKYYLVNIVSNKVRFTIDDDTANPSVETDTVSSDQWYHVVATRDLGNRMKIYLNGELNGSAPDSISGDIGAILTDITIGDRYDGDRSFYGQIDEVIILNRSMSEEEVKSLYRHASLDFSDGGLGLNWSEGEEGEKELESVSSTQLSASGLEIEDDSTHILPQFKFYSNDENFYSPFISDYTIESDDDSTPSFTISYPSNYSMFQRFNETHAEIRISGSFSDATSGLEARFDQSAWETIVGSGELGSGDGSFSASINGSIGQGNLEVRFIEDTMTNETFEYVTVGDIFVITGQSNADGRGNSRLDNNGTGLDDYKTLMYKKDESGHYLDEGWQIMRDPAGWGRIEQYPGDIDGHSTIDGTIYPKLSSYVMDGSDVPIGFIPSALGSTRVAHWTKGTGETEDMYSLTIDRITTATNGTMRVRGFIFYQGESDSLAGTTYETYHESMGATVSDFYNDIDPVFDFKFLLGQMHRSDYGSAENIRAISKAQQDLWYESGNHIYKGAVTYQDDPESGGGHWQTSNDMEEFARMWSSIMLAEFYGVQANGPDVVNVSMKDGSSDTVVIEYDENIKIGHFTGSSFSPAAVAQGWSLDTGGSTLTDSDIVSTAVDNNNLEIQFDTALNSGTLDLSLSKSGEAEGGNVVYGQDSDIAGVLLYDYEFENDLSLNIPILDSVDLVASSDDNTTNDNLSCSYSLGEHSTTAVVNWIRDESELMILNMPFEGGGSYALTDYSDFQNNGSNNGAQWMSDEGYDGNGSLYFGGNDDVNLGTIDLESTDFSISFWVKYTAPADNDYIISNYEGSDWYLLNIVNNEIRFAIDDGTNSPHIAHPLSDSVWHHIVAVRDYGDELKLYVDGDEVNQTADIVGDIVAPYDTYLGDRKSGDRDFTGYLDDVRIYTHVLSEQQISAMHDGQSNTIVSDETALGDVWACEVTPFSTENAGSTSTSGNLGILDEPLEILCAEVSSHTTLEEQLVCGAGEGITFSSDGITFDCDNQEVRGPGSGYGFNLEGINSITIRNCDISDFGDAIRIGDSANSIISSTAMHGSNTGLEILSASENNINDAILYNNSQDIAVSNSGVLAYSFALNDAIIRNDAGSISGQNIFDITDSVSAGSSYSVDWSDVPGSLPANKHSFSGKFLDISTTSGSVSIDEIVFKWTDAEVSGINESEIELWVYSSSWTLLNDSPDIENNQISYFDLVPASNYGLLHSGQATAQNSSRIDLYGANVTDYSHLERWAGLDAGSLVTEGGNITEVNITSDGLTDRWAAFFGNLTGNILLTDLDSGTSAMMYNWAYDPNSDNSTVCASTNGSLSSVVMRGASGADIDSAWGFGSATDSGANTFNETDCIMGIGPTFISNASYADTGPAEGFITCALRANNTGTIVKDDFIFCSNATASTNYRNEPADFEIMVPTDNAVGATETYYFYANLN